MDAPDQLDQALALCDSLELRALADLGARVQAGEALGPGDLRLIEDIRARLQTRKAAAAPAGDAAVIPSPALAEWLPLDAVAAMIGVNAKTLQRWCAAKTGAYAPALPHRVYGRKLLAQPAAAYEHLKRHGRDTGRLRPPPGYVAANGAAAPAAGAPWAFTATSARGRLKELADLDALNALGSDRYRALVSVLEAQAKMESGMTHDDAIRVLRSGAELFCRRLHDDGARALAQRMVDFARRELGADLLRANAAAVDLLEQEARAVLNSALAGLTETVEDACREVALAAVPA